MIAHWPARGTSICMGDDGGAGCPEQSAPEQGRRRCGSVGVDASVASFRKTTLSNWVKLNSYFGRSELVWT
jgi:hypothetical protein